MGVLMSADFVEETPQLLADKIGNAKLVLLEPAGHLPKVPVLNQVVRESKSVRSVCTSATARGQAQPHGSVSG